MLALYVVLGLLGLFVLLLLAACARAALIKDRAPAPKKLELPAGDETRYAEKLSALVQCETVSNENTDYKSTIYEFHKVLKREFPLFFKTCDVKDLEGSLLFKWSGSGEKQPILLLAHQDVVEASGEWAHGPYSGDIADGRVWGRGTLDCKGTLAALALAAEELMGKGFTPARDIYFAFGDSEEIGGPGAARVASYLKEQGLSFEMILDEGGAVLESAPFPGIKGNFGVIGIMEKGIGNFKFTARSPGGHSSTPPKNTPIARLAAFVDHVEKRSPMKKKITEPVREMFSRMAPQMAFPMRLVLGNLWLFGPLLKWFGPKISPMVAALFQTTCVFTMMRGSNGYNVIPENAYVIANLRFMTHEGLQQSFEKLSRIAARFGLETEIVGSHNDCSPTSDIDTDCYRFIERTAREILPADGMAPYVVMGATDARFYTELSPTVLRFGPFVMDDQQFRSTHAIDENIYVGALRDGVAYYRYMMENI